MMKAILSITMISISLLGFNQEETKEIKEETKEVKVETKEIKSDEFKFSMTVSIDTKLESKIKGKWGGLWGGNEKLGTEITAFGFKGKLVDEEIIDFAVQESGIPVEEWSEVKKEENINGFEWREIYKVSKNDKTLYAVVSKNQYHNIYYMFFIMAPNEIFEKHKEGWDAWLQSCKGLK